jgi:Zn-finger nucleic acid-binding protein
MTFADLFTHIDDCPRCDHISLDLCEEGKRIRDAAGEHTTKLTSPGTQSERTEGS